MDGILIIDKPRGLTSQRVVEKVKRATGVAKAGHTGTLDPLATGVLPVALGEATKIIGFLDESRKSYEVEGKLGVSTDTYDSEGRVVEERDPLEVTEAAFLQKLESFLGIREQIPPPYSAVKFQGQPLYAYARRGISMTPKSRQVHFHRLELHSFANPHFSFQVTCSKGTYVRSLVHQLGIDLNCGAHVTGLRRLRSGSFCLERALTWEQFLSSPESAWEKIFSIEDCLSELPQVNLDSSVEQKKILAGAEVPKVQQWFEKYPDRGPRVVIKYDGLIHALVSRGPENEMIYDRVLVRG